MCVCAHACECMLLCACVGLCVVCLFVYIYIILGSSLYVVVSVMCEMVE